MILEWWRRLWRRKEYTMMTPTEPQTTDEPVEPVVEPDPATHEAPPDEAVEPEGE